MTREGARRKPAAKGLYHWWRDPYYNRKQNSKWKRSIDRLKARRCLEDWN